MASISILGCGWLGKPLGTALITAGHVVYGSTTREENISVLQRLGIKPFILSIDREISGTSIQEFFSSHILIISVPPKRRAGLMSQYLIQVEAILDAAKRGNVNNIILISSTSVYPNLNRVVAESDADPLDELVRAEQFVMNSTINATVIRFGGLFGPERHPGKFLAGKKDLKGANAPVNMIHLDDCVSIIVSIIKRGLWNQVFNACADEHPTKKEFYTRASIDLGLEPPHFAEAEDQPFKVVSNEKLKAALNYSFIHKLT
jgi:nucleoside-diphosphate-sugar epimerase